MIFITLALLSFQLTIAVSLNVQPVEAISKTIIVPDNYPSIASAINYASQFDKIIVRSGTYYENVFINKSISIIGEDSKRTTVVGNGGAINTYVFNVTADNVRISGFTIESANYSVSNPKLFAGGIAIAGDNCTVMDNNIVNVYRGIYVGGWGNFCGGISQTTIVGNSITGAFSDGIRIFGGSGNVISENNLIANKGSAIVVNGYSNVISNNNISGNSRGIGIRATYSIIFGNNITNSINWGMLFESPDNVITANYVANNRWGVYLSPEFQPQNNTFYHNDFVNNVGQVNFGSLYSVQSWDNGYPSGGNYWSNYASVDTMSGPSQNQLGGDGIVDVPFIINSNNTDRYPLVSPINATNSGTLPPPNQLSPTQNHTVALWHLDTLAPDGSTPDATGNNPIMFSPIPYLPNIVPGKFGQALNFTFYPYGVALASPSLDVTTDITISAWINIISFENSTYNNIFVQTADTLDGPTRIYGLAVNGLSPANATSGPQGAVCGYLRTDSGYNEIVTLTSAVKLDQWTHVVFTRSFTTGMRIYVNDVEQPVMVTYGSQNPSGDLKRGTEIYFGADISAYIDEVSISNIAEVTGSTAESKVLWLQWWFWTAVAGIVTAISVAALLQKLKQKRI